MTLSASAKGALVSSRKDTPLLLAAGAVLLLAVTLLLWPALRAVPVWDDLYSLIAIDVTASRGRPTIAATGDLIGFWRPAELWLNAVLRPLDPDALLPVKLVSLGLHALKVAALVALVRRVAPAVPARYAYVAGFVALVHPIAVSAIIQIDTVSEALAAAAIAWALAFVLDAMQHEGRARHTRLAGVAVCCAIALLGKESALPAVMAMPLAGFVAASSRRKAVPDLVKLGVVLAALCFALLAARYALGYGRPAADDGRYQIGFGINVVKNLLTVVGSLAFLGNTVSLINDRHATALLGFVPVLLGLLVVCRALLFRREAFLSTYDLPTSLACALVALAATSAPALAPMISEHNTALPSGAFLAAVLGAVAAAAFVDTPRGRSLAALAAVLAIVSGLVAMRDKANAAAGVGKIVAETRDAITALALKQEHVRVCIVPEDGRAYSIYRLAAQRWMPEEILWAQHRFPGKDISYVTEQSGPDCDLSVPDFATADPSR